jgi:hypothetical protein
MMSVAAAVVLGVTGTLVVAGPAAAATFPNTPKISSAMKACASAGCLTVASALKGPPPDALTDFCRRGTWDMVFNRSAARHAGFVQRSTLTFTDQFTDCATGGLFNAVTANTAMRTCANTACTLLNTTTPPNNLRDYCWQFGTAVQGNTVWHLIYNASVGVVGFLPEAALQNANRFDRCDD